MECRFRVVDIYCECLEWRRVLYRSLWAQVCTAHRSFHTLRTDHQHRFERELEALRKELAERSPPLTDVESLNNTPFIDTQALPAVDELLDVDGNTLEEENLKDL